MFARLRLWWRARRFDRARALVESHGLMVVRVVRRAGSLYLVQSDGVYLRVHVEKDSKAKR